MTDIHKYSPHLGVAIPKLGWIPAPRYSMRRARILDLVGEGPGNLLDIGCGPGAMLIDFNKLGWQACGLELAEEAHVIGDILHSNKETTIYKEEQGDWEEKFDVLMALEVVEHIEDDLSAIKQWINWLSIDGVAIFSVPAHPVLWNESDEKVGHYRRYTKNSLVELLENADLSVQHVEYYGFPVATLIEIVRFGPLTSRLKSFFGTSRGSYRNDYSSEIYKNRSEQSGTDRKEIVKYWPLITSLPYKFGLALSCWLQRTPLLRYFGNGLIIVARKKSPVRSD